MRHNNDRACFELVTGKKSGGVLEAPLPAGRAVSFPGTQYYVLKLWMFYNTTYYLVKNFDAENRYTVFAKKIEDGVGVKFLNPVGSGWISKDLITHLEVKFRFPSQSVFMCLFPS